MWSKELEEKIAKHMAFGKEILDYANSTIVVNLRFKSINKLAIELEKMRQTAKKEQKTREKNKPIVFKKQRKHKNISLPFFHKIEEMIEQYREEDREIKQLKSGVSHIPIYIQKLINAGFLKSDGKRATGTLNDIAVFLLDECQNEFKKKVTSSFLEETFLQANDNKWSKSAARQAVTYAYSISKRK